MSEQVYRHLCQTMAKRGGRYPGVDIPEFYALVRELFTPEEAAVNNAMPRGLFTAAPVAETLGWDDAAVEAVLEGMADKGLCLAVRQNKRLYASARFVPGIFEYQFMRGTSTDHDRKLARLIHDYKAALDARHGPPRVAFPSERVIPVDRQIDATSRVHTYDQVVTYIREYDPLSVSTCFCRHEAQLLDENDTCGKPNEVCMQFGLGAQFVIDRGLGRRIDQAEALEILRQSEEAGLVHSTQNRQSIDFLCNCCACHCMIIQTALAQPKPALALSSGFQPAIDPDLCTGCGTCIERCPATALILGENDVPQVDLDRCFGCGVCATGCPAEAISLLEKTAVEPPPVDQRALSAAIKAARQQTA